MKTQNTIDIFRRVALHQILKTTNISINSEHIYNSLNKYIQYGNQSLVSLSDMYTPSTKNIYLSNVMAKYLLAFLEMYTQYIINAGNELTIKSLSDVSYSKYQYSMKKYKELDSLIKEKTYSKEYKYVSHINFATLNPSSYNIDAKIYDDNLPQLSYNDMLSLPLLSSTIIKPEYTSAYINDKYTSDIIFDSNNIYVNASINRINGSHIGIIKDVACSSDITYNFDNILSINGIINGYISENIFVKILDLYKNENQDVYMISYTSSVDGLEWEFNGTFLIDDTNLYDIYVLNNLNTGIKFSFKSIDDTLKDKVFLIKINSSKISNAICYIKSIFNITLPISYIKYNDISEFKLKLSDSAKLQLDEQDNLYVFKKQLINSTSAIVPIDTNIYSFSISGEQSRYSLSSNINGNALLKYDFNIDEIYGYSNEYYKSGSLLLSKLSVENITTLMIDSSFSTSNTDLQRTFILYSAILNNKYGSSEIPIIHCKNNNVIQSLTNGYFSLYIYEPVIQNNSNEIDDENINYITKFKYEESQHENSKLYIFNPDTEILLNQSSDVLLDKNNLYINTNNLINASYCLYATIKVGTVEHITLELNDNSLWMQLNNRIVYMYYLDYDGYIKTAIKTIGDNGLLIPFTGDIYERVTMYSVDESFISPYISDITFGAI